MTKTERNGQVRGLQTVDDAHVLSENRWRGWNEMIRWDAFKQLTKFTYILETDEEDGMGWSMRIFKQLTKFTYILDTDEEDGMGWSDERPSNNWPSSRTNWRRMKRMGWNDQMRGHQTIDQVHVLTRDGWRRWHGMIRWEVFKQLTKFTYVL